MSEEREALKQVVSTRCSDEESIDWHRYARERGETYSSMNRIVWNNLTGRNDPPELGPWKDTDLHFFTKMTAKAMTWRKRRRPKRSPPVILFTAAPPLLYGAYVHHECLCCLLPFC